VHWMAFPQIASVPQSAMVTEEAAAICGSSLRVTVLCPLSRTARVPGPARSATCALCRMPRAASLSFRQASGHRNYRAGVTLLFCIIAHIRARSLLRSYVVDMHEK